jgi:hypothetical protein
MSEFNQLFQKRPMDLFRKYPVAPPSDGGQSNTPAMSVISTLFTGLDRFVTSTSTSEVQHLEVSSGVVWINFKRNPSMGGEADALTFEIGRARKPGWVPIHFLPWKSMSVVSLKIPEFTGGSFGDADSDAENPRLFFTAQISGCSVFAEGNPRSPMLYHGGLTGSMRGFEATHFWRQCLKDIMASQGRRSSNIGEVSRWDYSMNWRYKDPNLHAVADEYRQFLENDLAKGVVIEEFTPWGCVFGIRYGTLWSFYLQQNATITTLSLTKKSDTEFVRNPLGVLQYMRDRATKNTVVAKKTGPFKRQILYKQTVTSRPIQILEFFPQNKSTIKIERQYRVLSRS